MILEHSAILLPSHRSSSATIGASGFTETRPWLKYDDKLCDFLLDFAFLSSDVVTLFRGEVEMANTFSFHFWNI